MEYKIKKDKTTKNKIQNQFKHGYNNRLFLVNFLQLPLSLAEYVETAEVAVYNCFSGCSKCSENFC